MSRLASKLRRALSHAVKPVLLVIATAISVMTPGRNVAAQQSAPSASVLRAPLNVEMPLLAVYYGDPSSVHGMGAMYVGEPLVVDIGIVNRAENQLGGPVRRAEADWFQRVNVMVYPGDSFQVNETQGIPLPCEAPQPRGAYLVSKVGDDTLLSAGGIQYLRCRVEDIRALLAPGRYSVRAMWSANADPRLTRCGESTNPGPSYLTGVCDFEVRDARSDGERLDLLVHLATHAKMEERFDDALRLTDQIVRINPNKSARMVAATGYLSEAS